MQRCFVKVKCNPTRFGSGSIEICREFIKSNTQIRHRSLVISLVQVQSTIEIATVLNRTRITPKLCTYSFPCSGRTLLNLLVSADTVETNGRFGMDKRTDRHVTDDVWITVELK